MAREMKNVLVTGAAGFIGRKLCRALLGEGRSVRGLDLAAAEGAGADWRRADITKDPLDVHCAGMDTVFHLAGKAHAISEMPGDDEAYYRLNTGGTRRILEASKKNGVERFIFFSTVKAMGEGGLEREDESAPCRPQTPYGQSKLDAEKLVLKGGFVSHPAVLRLSMVYGAGSKGNLPRMIEAVIRGRFPPMPEAGNRRSMVHTEDAVRAAISAAAMARAAGQIYIVTDGRDYSTRQIYEGICHVLEKEPPGWSVPLFGLKMLGWAGDAIGKLRGRRFIFDSDALEKLTGSACYSTEKIKKELGFAPKWDLWKALPEMAEEFRGSG